jgi:hypothetical protein
VTDSGFRHALSPLQALQSLLLQGGELLQLRSAVAQHLRGLRATVGTPPLRSLSTPPMRNSLADGRGGPELPALASQESPSAAGARHAPLSVRFTDRQGSRPSTALSVQDLTLPRPKLVVPVSPGAPSTSRPGTGAPLTPSGSRQGLASSSGFYHGVTKGLMERSADAAAVAEANRNGFKARAEAVAQRDLSPCTWLLRSACPQPGQRCDAYEGPRQARWRWPCLWYSSLPSPLAPIKPACP